MVLLNDIVTEYADDYLTNCLFYMLYKNYQILFCLNYQLWQKSATSCYSNHYIYLSNSYERSISDDRYWYTIFMMFCWKKTLYTGVGCIMKLNCIGLFSNWHTCVQLNTLYWRFDDFKDFAFFSFLFFH